jgi:hypothetical protein
LEIEISSFSVLIFEIWVYYYFSVEVVVVGGGGFFKALNCINKRNKSWPD